MGQCQGCSKAENARHRDQSHDNQDGCLAEDACDIPVSSPEPCQSPGSAVEICLDLANCEVNELSDEHERGPTVIASPPGTPVPSTPLMQPPGSPYDQSEAYTSAPASPSPQARNQSYDLGEVQPDGSITVRTGIGRHRRDVSVDDSEFERMSTPAHPSCTDISVDDMSDMSEQQRPGIQLGHSLSHLGPLDLTGAAAEDEQAGQSSNDGQFSNDVPELAGCDWVGPEGAVTLEESWIQPHLDSCTAPAHEQPSWTAVEASKFSVRCGDNYKKTGAKQASEQALFECVGMHMFQSKRPVYHIASQLKRPVVERGNQSPDVPTLFVLNVMVPTSSPSMFSSKTNGETINVVYFFVIQPWAAAALADLENAPPSVKLIEKYFRQAPKDGSRAKLIGQVCNWSDAKLPGMLSSWNSKPTLVTKSGTWYSSTRSGGGYAELDLNTAQWCYMARQGLHSSWKNITRAIFDFAVLIEAREDEFMPEQVLGAVTCNHIRFDGTAVPKWQGSDGDVKATDQVRRWKCQGK